LYGTVTSTATTICKPDSDLVGTSPGSSNVSQPEPDPLL